MFIELIRKGFILIFCVFLFNVLGWVNGLSQPSYAVSSPAEARREIQRDQSMRDREEAYEEAVDIIENPKMGVEKEYEAEVEEYYEEHPEEAGIVEEAKELVNKVTGQNK